MRTIIIETNNNYSFYLMKSKINKKIFSLAVSVSATLVSGNAMTQPAENNIINLETIVVTAPIASDTRPVDGYNAISSTTATKTDTKLLDIPQSISVVTQDIIKDQSVQSVAEAIRYVPGVQALQGEGNRDAIVLRGNATTGDFFVDGVRDDVQTYRDLYNTDRIEILKGSNGMIFGRGGAGGVVNRVSKEAGWDPVRQLTASYGAYNQRRIAGDFGQSLTEDIAFRLNSVYENSNSYRDGVNIERYGATPTFTIRPSDNTKVVIGAEYFKDKRIADRGIPSANGAYNDINSRKPFNLRDNSAFFGSSELSPTDTETFAFNAMIEHQFNSGINVKNRTRWANYNKFYQNVFANSSVANDGTFAVSAYNNATNRENVVNQTDLTYTAKWWGIENKLLTGMELVSQDTKDLRMAGFFNNNFTSTGTQVNLNANNTTQIGNMPVSFRPNLVNSNSPFSDIKSTVDTVGLYVQDQIIFSPKWQAILGLRYDKFQTNVDSIKKGTTSGTTVSENFDVTNNLLSPRAGLIFKPIEPVSIYANYSISYVPRAGDQLTSLTLSNKTFDPEKFTNYEIGAKWDVNSNFALTSALYILERANVAITDPQNITQTILVDGQETRGIELGFSGNITEKWSVFGGYAYQDGEITKQQGIGANAILKGTQLAQTPKHTFSLWNRYNINNMWGAAIGVVSRSDMYAQLPTATQSAVLPAYARLDAALFAKLTPQLRLQMNMENLTNENYVLTAHNNNNIMPGSPITGRVTLSYDF